MINDSSLPEEAEGRGTPGLYQRRDAPRRVSAAQFPRWFVGLVLIATGAGKALDIPGFAQVVTAYNLSPPWGSVVLAYSLPFIELATGIGLVAQVRLRAAAWCAVALHTMLLTAVLITLWRGLAIANCGCFGVFLARPLTWRTALEDAAMLALSLVALRIARRS